MGPISLTILDALTQPMDQDVPPTVERLSVLYIHDMATSVMFSGALIVNILFHMTPGLLPDASQGAQHLRDVFYRMGFDDRGIGKFSVRLVRVKIVVNCSVLAK